MNTAPASSPFRFHPETHNATWDVIDHSPQIDAIQRAFAECHALLRAVSPTLIRQAPQTTANADGFVERAMSLLLLHECDFTATDFRLIGWSDHDRSPRAWGCYRIQHAPSEQWLELVVSHVQTAHPNGDGKLLLNSIALSLDAAINHLGSAAWPCTSNDIGERPTLPAALASNRGAPASVSSAAPPRERWHGPGLAEPTAHRGNAFGEADPEAISVSFSAA